MNISSSLAASSNINPYANAANNSQIQGVNGNNERFSKEELEQIAELKRKDREVRAHEQAHLAAAGPYAKGGASFTYQKGPDGKNYAVGGEVQIDTSPVSGDPEATIRKAQQIQRAANAPASPSGQDRAVAADAAATAVKAQLELAKQAQEELKEDNSVKTSNGDLNNQSADPTAGYKDKEELSQILDDLI